jgi:hypothetical protein
MTEEGIRFLETIKKECHRNHLEKSFRVKGVYPERCLLLIADFGNNFSCCRTQTQAHHGMPAGDQLIDNYLGPVNNRLSIL